MEKPFLSIIIPVYNVEEYLKRCVDSVLNQNINNKIEILLIDDGSTDGSCAVCDELAEKYAPVSVFHKENGGLSSARNVGINVSKGEYIQFLDSDDTLEPNSIDLILSALNNKPDVLICRYNEIDVNNGVKSECDYHLDKEVISSIRGSELIENIISGKTYNWYAWLNVVNADFLRENKFYFTEGKNFEDVLWTPEVICRACSVDYLDKPVYNYYINRANSITRQVSEKVYQDKINAVRFINDFCAQNDFSEQLSNSMMGNISQVYVSLLADCRLFSKEKRRGYLKDIKKYDLCLKYASQTYKRILYSLKPLIGINGVSCILHIRAQYVRKKNNI